MKNTALPYDIMEYQVSDLSNLSYDKGSNLKSAKLYMRFDSAGELVLLSEEPITNSAVRNFYRTLADRNGWDEEYLATMLFYFQV